MGLPFAVYLVFNGNCRQAFNYYQWCLGGDLRVQTLADTPYGNEVDFEFREAVICATLENEYIKLVGTDLSAEGRIVSGNRMSIMIECDSFTHRAKLVNKLVGRNFCSLKNTDQLINVTDPYSVNWVLSVNA